MDQQAEWDKCPADLRIALMGYCRAAELEGHSFEKIQKDLVRILIDAGFESETQE